MADKPRKKRRPLLAILILLLIVVAGLIIAGPPIASAVARGKIESAVNSQIAGRVEVQKVSVSLFGSQAAGPITLFDERGERIATLEAKVGASGFGLIFGGRDLGEIVVSGDARIERRPDGTINVLAATAPRSPKTQTASTGSGSPSTPKPVVLPKALAATLVLDSLDVAYTDAALGDATEGAVRTIALTDLSGRVPFSIGAPIESTLKGTMQSGASADAMQKDGPFELNLALRGLTSADGTLTPDKLGGSATLNATSRGAALGLNADFTDGVVTTGEGTEVTLDLATWRDLVPAMRSALEGAQGVEFGPLPQATLTVDAAHAALPASGAPLDLRKAGAVLTFALGAISGKADPSALGAAGTASAPFSTEALTVRFDAGDLASGVRVTGGTRATYDNKPAGELAINASARDLLAPDGSFNPGTPTVEGEAALTGFSTAILQPFAALASSALPDGASLDLPTALGPTLDLSATASTEGSASVVTLVADSAHLDALVPLRLADERVTLAGDAATLTLTDAGELLSTLVGAYAGEGVSLGQAKKLTVAIDSLDADLTKLQGENGPDLRGLSAVVSFNASEIGGSAKVGDRTERFTLGPVSAKLDASALAEGRVTAALDAPAGVQGESPGRIALRNASITNLLDEHGHVVADSLPTVRGTFEVTDVSASLIDRFAGGMLEPMGIVVSRDLGARVERLALSADTGKPGETAITLEAKTPVVRVIAPLAITDKAIRSNGTIEIDHDDAAPLLNALAGDAAQLTRSGQGGKLRVRAFQIDVPFHPDTRTPRLDLTSATFTAQLGGTEVSAPTLPEGEKVVLRESRAEVKLAPGADPTATLTANLAYRGDRFDVEGNAKAIGLLVAPEGDNVTVQSSMRPGEVRPSASFALKQVPGAAIRVLAAAFMPPAEDGTPSPIPAVLSESIGQKADLTLTLVPHTDNALSDLGVNIKSPGTNGTIQAAVAPFRLDLAKFELTTRLTPASLDALRAAYAPADPAAGPAPALAANAPIKLVVKPFSLPMDGYVPAFERCANDFVADVELSDITVSNVTIASSEPGGGRRDLGNFALRGGRAHVELPIRNIPAERPPLKIAANASGRVVAVQTGKTGSITAETTVTWDGTKLAGEIPLKAELRDLPVGFVDGILGSPDLLTGLVGETLRLDLDTSLDPGGEVPIRRAQINVASPRLNTPQPLRMAVSGQTLRLVEPGTITATLLPAWANRHLLGEGKNPEAPPKFVFAEPVNVQIGLDELVLPQDVAAGPLKPGVFKARGTLAAPDTKLVIGGSTPASLGGVELRITPPQEAEGNLGFVLNVMRWEAAGQRSAQGQASEIKGTLFGLADNAGALTPEKANVSANLNFRSIPSRLIDAFAGQDLIEKTLGPSVSASGWVRHLSGVGGAYQLDARAANGNASIKGEVRPGALVIYQGELPIATLTRLTQDLTADLTKPLPLVQSFEKTPQDQPATLVAQTNLVIPTDGNMDRLNGVLVFDPGTAKYTARNDFAGLIKAPFVKSAGEVGKRLNPVTLRADRGIVTYDKVILPVGEFEAEVIGVINLSSREYNNKELDLKAGPRNPAAGVMGNLDVLTFVPVGALADEVVKLGKLPVLGNIGQASKFPLRTRGPIASPKTGPDVDMFVRTLSPLNENNPVNPGNLIDGIGNLIGGGKKDGGG